MPRRLPLLAATFAALLLVGGPAGAILPPDPLSQVVPQAGLVVVGTVTAASGFGPVPTTLPHADGWVGPALDLQAQTVTIKVTEALRWPKGTKKPKAGTMLTVIKPVRPYRLTPGEAGIMLLDTCAKQPMLLGRYGSSFYDPAELRAAVKAMPSTRCP